MLEYIHTDCETLPSPEEHKNRDIPLTEDDESHFEGERSGTTIEEGGSSHTTVGDSESSMIPEENMIDLPDNEENIQLPNSEVTVRLLKAVKHPKAGQTISYKSVGDDETSKVVEVLGRAGKATG